MSCGCNQIETPCQPTEPCLCEVRPQSDCITVSGATNYCLGIDDNLILTDYLSQLDDKICEKIASVVNFIALKNVGTGAEVYKGIDVLGKKEIRSLKSLKPELVIAQTTDEITFDLNIPSVTPPDGSETKLQAGTNTTVSGNGTIATPYAVNVTFPTIDGSETKLSNGTNTTVSGNGTIATPYTVNVTFPIIDGSETKVQAGTNVAVSGNGTTATPYIINSVDNSIPHLEFSNTDRTIWNNGKGDIDTNTSFGESSLSNNTTGFENTANGTTSLFSNTTGNKNTANGYIALFSNISGNSNVGFGYRAGGVIGTGFPLTVTNNSVFIGAETKALLDNCINEIVIGYNATGSGSNTTTIGNTSITKTVLRGIVETNGGFAKIGGTSTQMLMADGSVKENQDNLQREITTSTTLSNTDNNYTIFINNGATPITITINTAVTTANFGVGFIQEGTGDVTFVGAGVTLSNPVGLKSKGQGYATYIERKLNTNTFYLLGDTKN